MADGGSLTEARNEMSFPPADADGVLNPEKDTDFKVDPISSEMDKIEKEGKKTAEEIGFSGATDETHFPTVDVEGALYPGKNKNLKVDPVSSQLAKKKEEGKAVRKKNKCATQEAMQTWKTTIIISGVVLAVAGAVFAITKKLKEK